MIAGEGNEWYYTVLEWGTGEGNVYGVFYENEDVHNGTCLLNFYTYTAQEAMSPSNAQKSLGVGKDF